MNPTTLPEFYRLIESRLGVPYVNDMGRVDRNKTMGWLFRELEARFPDGPRIVETGCIRSPEDWSAGYATWLFHEFIKLLDRPLGFLISVDNDKDHIDIALRLVGYTEGMDLDKFRVAFVQADSAALLADTANNAPNIRYDLAYLDSCDTYLPGHAEHGLAEAKAASRIVAPNGLIVFDDTPADGKCGWQGKGKLGVPWLLANGWKLCPVSSYQAVLERA